MSVEVKRARATDPGPRALVDASQALMRSLYPPEENHFLPIEALDAADIRFFAAYDGDMPLGCGALQVATIGGIVKLRTAPSAGRRIAILLIALMHGATALFAPVLGGLVAGVLWTLL